MALGLASVFANQSYAEGPLDLLNREPNIYSSTFASEVVTCRYAGGPILRLLCKHDGRSENYAYGHRGGVSYEARIYLDVLRGEADLAPKVHGTFQHALADDTCLVLEYLDGATRLNRAPDPAAVAVGAARRLGAFHAATEFDLAAMVNSYDLDYYRGWARRTAEFSGACEDSYPWLSTLCAEYERLVGSFLELPRVVIHGECYPMNILVRGSAVYFIDWETAALAPGEIDLAALTEGWDATVVAACKREYCRARWPEATVLDFEHRLWAARLYWGFRWLGDRPAWTAAKVASARFRQLRTAGEHLGLI